MKKILLTSVLLFFLFFQYSYSQVQNKQQNTLNKVSANKEQVLNREELKIRERVINFNGIEERKIEAQNNIKEIQKRIESVKEERKEETKNKREGFEQEALEKGFGFSLDRLSLLNDKINRLNENFSKKYFSIIGAIEIILEKTESRIEKLEKEKNLDLSLFYSRIEEIKEEAISAKEIVANQQLKIYIPDVSIIENNEKELEDINTRDYFKTKFRESLSGLKEDHRIIREDVINKLKGSVRELIEDLKISIN